VPIYAEMAWLCGLSNESCLGRPLVASDSFSTSYRNYFPSCCDFPAASTISWGSPATGCCATIREGQIGTFVLLLRRRVCSQRFLPSWAGRNLPGQQAVFTFWRRKAEPFPARLRRRGGFLLRRCAKESGASDTQVPDGRPRQNRAETQRESGRQGRLSHRRRDCRAHCGALGGLFAVKPGIAKSGAQRGYFLTGFRCFCSQFCPREGPC